MNNILLSVTLGLALTVCLKASSDVYNAAEQEKILNEKIHYALAGLNEDTMFGGFNEEEISEWYAPPVAEKGKVFINVPVVNQFPELPVGCEIASATALLQYLGVNADKVDLAENYIYKNDYIYDDIHHFLYGPDPKEYFVGDPFTRGYGCYSPAVVEMLNRYFTAKGSIHKGVDLRNITEDELVKLLDNGIPVIVWASQDMGGYIYRESSQWTVKKTGENIRWLGNSHTLVLIGYDNDNFYFSDCNDKPTHVSYNRKLFISRWMENGAQAVAVKLYNEDVPNTP